MLKKTLKGPSALTINPFRFQAGRVVRLLMKDVSRKWNGEEIAKELGVTARWVNVTLDTLESLGLAERRRARHKSWTQLKSYSETLLRWKATYSLQQNKRALYYIKSSDSINVLHLSAKKLGIKYCLTGTSATNLRKGKKPKDEAIVAYIIIPKNMDEEDVLQALEVDCEFIPVAREGRGENLILMIPRDPEGVVFDSSRVDGINIVSPLQEQLDS